MKPLLSINPSTGLIIRSYNQHNNVEIQNILDSSWEAQKVWKNTNLKFYHLYMNQLIFQCLHHPISHKDHFLQVLKLTF